MLQNSILIEERYHKFIKTICETQVVYALKNTKGYATSASTQYEDEDGDEIELICFWSQLAYVRACTSKEWKEYTPEEITLASFIENWCIGMYDDGVLAGVEFDQKLFGFEADTIKVALDIIEEIKSCNTELPLRRFEHIHDMKQFFESLMEEDI